MLQAMTDARSRAAPSAPTERAGLDAAGQARLVAALMSGGAFGVDPAQVKLLETHISYVFLTGEFAYKLKKAVNLGFLDFSNLSARRFYCEEELRLNRRLAADLYVDVVAITGDIDAPVIGGKGPVLEYAVKMREFPQDALASRVLARGELRREDIDALASGVAAFHRAVSVARPRGAFGLPEEILRAALQNFAPIRPLLESDSESADVDALERWTLREYAARASAMLRRRDQGFVRECHGDLHLGNIALIDGKPIIFECIEFNKQIRWVDVMSEVAFTAMDLEDRRHPDLGHRFLNAYLEITGDYDGLAVLRFYLVYRAMVRAKIARLRAAQLSAVNARAAALREYAGYIELAKRCARPPHPAIVITHGLSGCGKTTLSQTLLELTGAVRIRTDVERKRALGETGPREKSGIDAGLYSLQATEATYKTVLGLARTIADAGWIAIVDGAFVKRWQRELFRKLAVELHVGFVIVSFAAEEATLRARIEQRQRVGRDASDADLAVLGHQLRTQEPLAAEELADAVSYDAEAPLEEARSPARWRAVLRRFGEADSTTHRVAASAPAGADPGLAAKVAFLLQPQSYPEPTAAVMPIETHMSWVFLTDRFAYKLKKPVRRSYLDFSTEASRQRNCSEEVRLNQRLSNDVYLGTVPLTLDPGGGFRVGGSEHVVDWLVKMRRLPAERMLDRLIRDHAFAEGDVRRAVARLSRFYCAAAALPVTPAAYRKRIAEGIDENLRELTVPRYALPGELVKSIGAKQRRWLDSQAALFDARVEKGRVIEAHGDLRPEHICLEPEPQIIDCLEFSADFRMLDAADELAFLALECERLGAPELRPPIFATHAEVTEDAPPDALLHFYQSYRACLRARIAIWHLDDSEVREPRKWSGQAMDYLRLAQTHLELTA
jgi:aminoglycoside phosphotransferase family enzyme/predicted kinase